MHGSRRKILRRLLASGVTREAVEDQQNRKQIHVRAAPHEPAAEHLIVNRADAESRCQPDVMGVERLLRYRQQHAECRALRGRCDEVEDLKTRVRRRVEPGRGLDNRPPEEDRRRKKRDVFEGVDELVFDRRIVQRRQMP